MAAPPKPSPSAVADPVLGDPTEEKLDVVETPTSPSSAFALSRFEFETDKGNDGTKILMIEWDGAAAAVVSGKPGKQDFSDWEISWEGKGQVLPIRDTDPGSNTTKRVFYLLPPGAQIPTLVTISKRGGGPSLRTKPMPAIFPAGLGSENKDAGKRGVLHTIWAKKRLAELEAEITEEMKTNTESIGLEMAIQDRDWIQDHFGIGEPSGPTRRPYPLRPQSPTIPTSPRSPIGGKLGEKLRGLKLATSPVELAAATQASKTHGPDGSASSHGALGGRSAGRNPGESSIASLDAVVDSDTAKGPDHVAPPETEEELFALPMSPRSPEMKRSPFSML